MDRKDDLDNVRWLLGPEGRAALEQLESAARPADVVSLRKRYAKGRAELLYETMLLRRRAERKFPSAHRLFFTSRALEQATGYRVASWRATRYAGLNLAADLCCGVGGDLLQLVQNAARILAIDCDLGLCWRARANVRAVLAEGGSQFGQCQVVCSDVRRFPVERVDAWYLDPDRRVGGRRTVSLEHVVPGRAAIEALWRRQPSGAVKLAPGTDLPQAWKAQCEMCWVSADGECKELVVFRGSTARQPGHRVAVRIEPTGESTTWAMTEQATCDARVPPATDLKEILYEADAALLTSGLVIPFAATHGLVPVTRAGGYLTGPPIAVRPWLTPYEVLDLLPLDERRIRRAVRRLGLSVETVKQRGVKVDVARWQKRFRVESGVPAVLIATRLKDRPAVIVARPADLSDRIAE